MSIKRRSRLEEKFEKLLIDFGVKYSYETTKIPYIVPESNHNYTVDFSIVGGLQLEVKGYLSDYSERHKYILIKQQHPDLDLRFVFDNSNKLVGGAKMTHGKWAEKYGFPYCSIKDIDIIESWLKEQNANTS